MRLAIAIALTLALTACSGTPQRDYRHTIEVGLDVSIAALDAAQLSPDYSTRTCHAITSLRSALLTASDAMDAHPPGTTSLLAFPALTVDVSHCHCQTLTPAVEGDTATTLNRVRMYWAILNAALAPVLQDAPCKTRALATAIMVYGNAVYGEVAAELINPDGMVNVPAVKIETCP